MSCFVNGNLVTEVLPLSGVLTFLKATDSPGLQTRTVGLWTCAHGARAHSMKCFVLEMPVLDCLSLVLVLWRVWWSCKKAVVLDLEMKKMVHFCCIGHTWCIGPVVFLHHPISERHLMCFSDPDLFLFILLK